MPREHVLYVKRLNSKALMPTKGSEEAAGYDLYATSDTRVLAHESALVETGIAMMIPFGYYGRVAARSGLSVKTGLMVNAGVIDSDYRGEIKVLLANPTKLDVEIPAGTKMAQIIIEKIAHLPLQEVQSLMASERGVYGFGSSGNSAF